MTSLTQTHRPAAFAGGFPVAHLIVAAAVMLGLAGGSFLLGVLSALPQAGAVGTRPSLPERALPSAQASGGFRADTSVPDASVVLSGRETVDEEPAPTF